MRIPIARALIVALTVSLAPVHVRAEAPTAAHVPGEVVQGAAMDVTSTPLACASVRLRHLETGTILDNARVDADGSFALSTAGSGSYLVEAVDTSGRVLGSSVATADMTAVNLTTATNGCPTEYAANGAAQDPQEPATPGGEGWSGLSAGAKTAIILGIAAGIGVAAWAIARDDDDVSPSQ